MATRLGLDIGANSIGWCLYDGDSIRGIGARIFSDGRDPKSGASLAVDRRTARAARRSRDRYVRRRSALFEVLVETGLMPPDVAEARALADLDPYLLRKRGLDEPLSPFELGRAIFHLNQRRGFKSNRKADRAAGDEKESGKIASGAKALDLAMQEAGARTYGEFLFGRDTRRVRIPVGGEAYDFYPERRHLEHEFYALCAAQAQMQPEVIPPELQARLRRIIFFQRPLKTPEVGGCTFFNTEKRLPKAHPLFQERRLYEEVNHLQIVSPGAPARKLTLDQRDALVLKLRGAKSVTFKSLAKVLKLQPDEAFNKAGENRSDLAGDEVFAAFSHKSCLGDKWAHFDRETQWSIIEAVAEEEDPIRLYDWLISNHGVTQEAAEKIGRIRLPQGYGRLGETATQKILEALKAEVVTYSDAVQAALGASHSDFRTGEILDSLPYYGEILGREIPPGTLNPDDPDEVRYGRITNPTVHIGLNQLRRIMNAVIRTYGRPDEIVVELARELKLNEAEKAKRNKELKDNTRAAQARAARLEELKQPDTGANRMLLRLWEDLNPSDPLDRACPFCGGAIGISSLFSDETEVEHVLPYSMTLDDSPGNKVIAHRKCNREKGNRTPWQAWGDTPRWGVIEARIPKLHESRQWRFAPDAMDRFDKGGDFIARQLTDTQYLARMARSYLSSLYPEKAGVYVIPGRMTAMLRRLWGLNELLPDHNYVQNPHSNAPKNRLDHRHHAIDAAVVGATTRGLLNEVAKAAGRAENQHLDRLFEGLPTPWPEFRNDLRDALSGVIVSHKPDHGRRGHPPKGRDSTSARLHNDTAYGPTGRVSATGLPIVVHRIPLASLEPDDLRDPERIPDPVLRNALLRVTEGLVGKEFQKALLEFSASDPVFRGLRHVRVREGLKTIPIRDRNGRVYKGYKGDANALCNIWRLPDGSWRILVSSVFESHQRGFLAQKPHPAARKLMSLRQNDLIAVERVLGEREILRVVKFAANGQIMFAHHQESGSLKERDKTNKDSDPFKYISGSASGLKKMRARQIRVDPLGRVFDPGFRE